MTDVPQTPRAFSPSLRIWPGVAAVALQWLVMFGVPVLFPEHAGTALLGGVAGGLAVVLWWLFFSRTPWADRLGVLVLIVVALSATSRVVHVSIATGMMGLMLFLYAIPILSLALVGSAAASRGWSSWSRRALMAAAVLIACGAMTLIRTDGITGDAAADFEWRWTPTAEERLLARAASSPAAAVRSAPPVSTPAPTPAPEAPAIPERVESAPPPAAPAGEPPVVWKEPAWPGFRGAARDGVVRGVRIATDWAQAPPVQLWRRPIGPGWSSFAVDGNRFYTQEQRGDDEVVAAYDVATGEPVWRHRDATRFWESNGGPGPRATPTLAHGRVYTLGATGILNALDSRTGSLVWSRNAASELGRTIPDWGIAGSPLVVGEVVIVAVAGWLAAYDAATGAPRWLGPKRGSGYSSPHLATIGGVEQVVLVNGAGALAVSPSDGAVLWSHAWPGDSIVQPAVLADGDVLIGSGSGLAGRTGMLRLAVERGESGWTAKEAWTSNGLKPYFNDFVVHAGHAFGFDGSILACIDLADGARKWKGGRYGHGQLVLLPDQDLLLVLSEDGGLALVRAAADRFTELARAPAIDGKTWNHPVLIGDTLLVRNGEEMAAFRLPLAPR